MCLAPADDYSDCTVVFRNTPVAVMPAGTATCFPSLDCASVLPDLGRGQDRRILHNPAMDRCLVMPS
ncbi:hypothetical protein [Streptomyces sp. NPDC059701]|uniref:hypothetical protein n=1 Tax=Streptomyces sp. NPDC059701 TaxID=3346914 RepID=UPI00369A295B